MKHSKRLDKSMSMNNDILTTHFVVSDIMLSIIIPVFNEESILRGTLDRIIMHMETTKHKNAYEVVIVNDGSTDDTRTIMNRIRNKKVVCVHHDTNHGITSALKTGLLFSQGDTIATFDSDMSYPIYNIDRMLLLYGNSMADIVIGIPRVLQTSPFRCILSKTSNFIESILFGINLGAISSVCRIWDANAMKKVLLNTEDDGFAGLTESVIHARRMKMKVLSTKVTYNNITGRKSRMNLWKTIKAYIRMNIRLLGDEVGK